MFGGFGRQKFCSCAGCLEAILGIFAELRTFPVVDFQVDFDAGLGGFRVDDVVFGTEVAIEVTSGVTDPWVDHVVVKSVLFNAYRCS